MIVQVFLGNIRWFGEPCRAVKNIIDDIPCQLCPLVSNPQVIAQVRPRHEAPVIRYRCMRQFPAQNVIAQIKRGGGRFKIIDVRRLLTIDKIGSTGLYLGYLRIEIDV